MLRTIIISPDKELSQNLQHALENNGGVSIVRTIDGYPDLVDFTRSLRSQTPQAVFISMESIARGLALASHVDTTIPGIQIVAVARSCEPAVLMEIMRAGIREFLAAPFEVSCVRDCLVRLGENLTRQPIHAKSSDLYSFLPAKPGVGATTLAINASIAATRGDSGSGVLLDFDLNCGMTRFMLKLNSSYSVLDAARHASSLDESLWLKMLVEVPDSMSSMPES